MTAGGEGGARGARGEAPGGAGGDTRGRGAAPAAASPPRCANPLHPDVRTRCVQMLGSARPDVRRQPTHRGLAPPPPRCAHVPGPSSCACSPRCAAAWRGGKLPAHPELIPGSSRAHPGPAASPSPSKAGTAGFSLLLAGTLPCGDRAAIPGFARGLSGEAGPPPCFPARCRGLPARPEMLRVPR